MTTIALPMPVLEGEKDAEEVRKVLVTLQDQVNAALKTLEDSIPAAAPMPAGSGLMAMDAKPGMTLAYVSGTTFTVSKGRRLSDDGGEEISAPALMTSAVNAAWSPADSGGVMDTGSAPATGTLHVYVIKRASDGAVRPLASDPAVTTPGSPVMPPGWTKKRYVGSLLTSGSAIRQFQQLGDEFVLLPPVATLNNSSPGTTNRVTFTATVPVGFVIPARVRFQPYSGAWNGRIYHYLEPDSVPVLVTNEDGIIGTSFNRGGVRLRVTDANGQLHYRLTQAAGAITIVTEGWIDRRMAFTGYE